MTNPTLHPAVETLSSDFSDQDLSKTSPDYERAIGSERRALAKVNELLAGDYQ